MKKILLTLAGLVIFGSTASAICVPNPLGVFDPLICIETTPSGGGDVTGPASSLDNEVVVFDGLTGKIIKNGTGCSIVSGVMTCDSFSSGDGTKTSGILLPELAANGTNLFAIFGAENQSSNICYFGNTTDTGPSQVLVDSGTSSTATLPDGSTLSCANLIPVSLEQSFSGVDTGSTDAYAANFPVCPSAYVTGGVYHLKAGTVNTGAATVNFCSLGAKTIKKWSSGSKADLASGDIPDEAWVTMIYDGTDMQLQTPLGNASGGGGLDVSTVGYCWVFTGCVPSGAATQASSALTGVSNNVVYMFQVLIPFTMKPATLRYNGSGSGSMAFAFYNDSGSNTPGSKVANTEGTTNSIGTSITVASAATLTPGVYWFGFAVSDNTQGYNKYHPAHSQAFTVLGGAAAAPRSVSCSNAASGGTYAMPATCGTATALTTYDFSLPVFMFLP